MSAGWPPVGPADDVVVVAQARSSSEEQQLRRWVESTLAPGVAPGGVDIVVVPFPSGSNIEAIGRALVPVVRGGPDPLLVPIRLSRRPSALERMFARGRSVGETALVGVPARLSDLREIWARERRSDGPADAALARFVGHRATLALEREEAKVLGPHYKVPRLVREDILTLARFCDAVSQLAKEQGQDDAEAFEYATKCLDEMVAGYTTLQIDAVAQLGRLMYRQGYDEQLDYDDAQVAAVQEAVRNHASVVLPTHRSQLDAGVMPIAFQELDLPKTHTLAGENMATWPVGPIMRRSGSIFIRRQMQDDPIYRLVLREYLGYLVEKRFPLEWYIEGGRSRTGKLLPPKLGLLSYVVDAYREGRIDDVMLVPASMTYDRLREVADYVGEAKGVAKKKEDLRWYVRYWQSLRGNYGKIYVRFGEPVSVRSALGPPEEAGALSKEERSLALQKLAFEVSWRINQVTPITAASIVTLALLSAHDQALDLRQLRLAVDEFVGYTEARALPTTDSAKALRSDAGLHAAIEGLVSQQVVEEFTRGKEPVYVIGPDQHLGAAFYRNSIIHFLLERSIAEVALVRAAEPSIADRVAAFWDEAFALRDILKFDFFFQEREPFRAAVAAELARRDPAWESRLADGPDAIYDLLRMELPYTASTTLRSFIEAYFVVARALQWHDDATDEPGLLKACDALGRQYLMQRRIRSPEAVSRLLFKPGLQLARGRGATADPEALAALTGQLRALRHRIDAVELVARQEFGALLTAAGH